MIEARETEERRLKETVRKSRGFPVFPTSNYEESLGEVERY